MYHSLRILIFCLFVSAPLFLRGQGTGNSPFSLFGIGDLLNNNGNVRNIGMGYAGVSARDHQFVNYLNPALLNNLRSLKKARPNHTYARWEYYSNLKIDSTIKIDFALNSQMKTIQSAGGKEGAFGTNIAYISFALPLSKTWATSFGIMPFSSVNYNLVYTDTVSGQPSKTAAIENIGKGGIYKIFWANGVGITNNLSLGLEVALVYGNINNQLTSVISDLSAKNYGFKYSTNYSSFGFKPGLQFRREIVKSYHDTVYVKDSTGENTVPVWTRKTKSSGMFYNIGFTYDFFSALHVTRSLNLYTIENNKIAIDTQLTDPEKYTAQLPSSLRLGFSLDVPMKWTVAADVFYSPWSVYQVGFNGNKLGDSYGVNVGGEYTLGNYKSRGKTVRGGFSYVKTPVLFQNHQLDDVSFSLGITVPFGKKKRDQSDNFMMPVRPKINVAVVLGQRGDVADFGVKEKYIKLYASFIINQKWFNKSKIY